uniref:Uncharacterized protein n=1 Tax=Rhizophora mucronata TaxID=61149 RepID=A0A2P2QVP9_RHIMU
MDLPVLMEDRMR